MIIKGQDNQMTEEKVRKRMEAPVYSLSLLWRETEYSYSTNGQPYREQLPGRRSFGICTMKCFMLDGTSYNNVGIAPDIYVEKRIEDMKAGFDRAMDEAIRYLRETVAKS